MTIPERWLDMEPAQVARRSTLLLLGGLLVAQPASANVGLPLLAVTWPGAWVLLVPVMLAETLVARRVLRATWGQSLKLAGWANVVSAALAVPLSWLLPFLPLVAIGSVARAAPGPLRAWLQAPAFLFWLPPIAESQSWLVPLMLAFLCLPAYAASVWIERKVGTYLLRTAPPETVQRWARSANRTTYGAIVAGLLIVALVLWLAR